MILSSARCSIHGSAQYGAGLLLCSRDNRRKELFMNAKDKEKLDVAGTIVGFMKGDTIVIDPDEFRRRADIKNKEFYEVEKDTERKEEKMQRCSAAISPYTLLIRQQQDLRIWQTVWKCRH